MQSRGGEKHLFLDCFLFVCYFVQNLFSRQTNISAAVHSLLSPVSASRREPHFYSYIPGPKTGDFSCPAESKLFQGSKMPPYVAVLSKQKPQHMVADF